jgi:hypothetical protein
VLLKIQVAEDLKFHKICYSDGFIRLVLCLNALKRRVIMQKNDISTTEM